MKHLPKLIIAIMISGFVFGCQSQDVSSSLNKNDELTVNELRFLSELPDSVPLLTNFPEPISIGALDSSGNVVKKYSGIISLAAYSEQSCTEPANGILSSTQGLSLDVQEGEVTWENLNFDTITSIYLKATTLDNYETPCSSQIIISEGSATGELIAGNMNEPVSIASAVDTKGESKDVLDFTLKENQSDYDDIPLIITQLNINISGTGDPSSSTIHWFLNGPDVSDLEGTYSDGEINFSDINIVIDDNDTTGETYTLSVYFEPLASITDGDTYILAINGDSDVTTDNNGSIMSGSNSDVGNGFGFIADVVTTQLSYATNPPASASLSTDFSGDVVIQSVDEQLRLDLDNSESVTLSAYVDSSCTTGASGVLSSTDTGSLSKNLSGGEVTWNNLSYNKEEIIYIKATSGSSGFTVCSNPITVSGQSLSGEVVAGNLTEPTTVSSEADTALEEVDVFDFTIREQANDGDTDPILVTEVRIPVSGTGSPVSSNITWKLNGPDVSDVTGTISAGKVTFSGLNISVADGNSTGETYVVSVYFSPTSTLLDNQTFILNMDGDVDLTLNPSGSIMTGSNSSVNNGTGFKFNVVARMFDNEDFPGTLDLQAVDANGKLDIDYNGSVTLYPRPNSSCVSSVTGSLVSSEGLSKSASSGLVSWTDLKHDYMETIYIEASKSYPYTTSCSPTSVSVIMLDDPTTSTDVPNAIIGSWEITPHILIGGYQDGSFDWNNLWRLESRLTISGALDVGFDSDGLIIGVTAGSRIHALGFATNNSSEFYSIGHHYVSAGDTRWRIERRNSSTGALITSFNTDGIYESNPSVGEDEPRDFDTDWANDIYVVGFQSVGGSTSDYSWRIERISDTNGTLVWAQTSNPSASWDIANSVEQVGSILFIGGHDRTLGNNLSWRIEKRFIATGGLDTGSGFGTSGVISFSNSTSTYCEEVIDMAATSSYLFIAGDDCTGWRIEKRAVTDGALDTAFDGDGVIPGNGVIDGNSGTFDTGRPKAICFDYDGNFLVAGSGDSSYGWIEKRDRGTGDRVPGFGSSGRLQLDFIPQAMDCSFGDIYITGGYSGQWRTEIRDMATGALQY
jgi:hypothetical protein